MSKPAIIINHLTVSYQSNPVLWDINLVIPQGILGAIIGPNGAGKTTLLKTFIGLIKPSAGTIQFFGQQHTAPLGNIAYVPQNSSIDWSMPYTVFDIVLMGTYGSLGWFRRPGKTQYNTAYGALDAVGLTSIAQTPIGYLSGGQKQRTLLARALAQKALLYLLDEPFNGIDQTTEQTMINVLKNLRNDGITILAVHHDLATAHHYFDWAALLNRKLIAYGPTVDVIAPNNLTTTYGKPLTQTHYSKIV